MHERALMRPQRHSLPSPWKDSEPCGCSSAACLWSVSRRWLWSSSGHQRSSSNACSSGQAEETWDSEMKPGKSTKCRRQLKRVIFVINIIQNRMNSLRDSTIFVNKIEMRMQFDFSIEDIGSLTKLLGILVHEVHIHETCNHVKGLRCMSRDLPSLYWVLARGRSCGRNLVGAML